MAWGIVRKIHYMYQEAAKQQEAWKIERLAMFLFQALLLLCT